MVLVRYSQLLWQLMTSNTTDIDMFDSLGYFKTKNTGRGPATCVSLECVSKAKQFYLYNQFFTLSQRALYTVS